MNLSSHIMRVKIMHWFPSLSPLELFIRVGKMIPSRAKFSRSSIHDNRAFVSPLISDEKCQVAGLALFEEVDR